MATEKCTGCNNSTGSIYETFAARNERTIKRLIFAVILCVILIFASNAAWLYAWCQYDYTSEETVYQQDGEGVNIIGSGNEAYYGTDGN